MIERLWFVGGRVGRAWIGETARRVRARVRRWRGLPDAAEDAQTEAWKTDYLLRRLEEDSRAVVERALAAGAEPLAIPPGGRAQRLRAAAVSHVVRSSWKIGISGEEALAIAGSGSLLDTDARLVEALARGRSVPRDMDSGAFQRRLALLEIIADASHGGVRRDQELEAARRVRCEEEVALRREAFARIERTERELAVAGAPEGAIRLLARDWQRLARLPLPSGELRARAEELAVLYECGVGGGEWEARHSGVAAHRTRCPTSAESSSG